MPVVPSRTFVACAVALMTACGISDGVVDLGSDRGADAGADALAPTGDASAIDAVGDAARRLDCARQPSACGYPDATNTGPPDTTALAPGSALSIKTNGTVVSNLDIQGSSIDIDADNVTVRNVRIVRGGGAGAGTFALSIRPGRKNVLIEDCVIAGSSKADDIQMAIFDMTSGGQVTIRRVEAFNCSQCITTVDATVIDSYVHDLSRPASTAIYHSCAGRGPVLRHNTLFNPFDTTAVVYLDPASPCGTVTIDDNLVAGGRQAFVLGKPPSSNLRTTNNRFARLYFANGGHDAPQSGFDPSGMGNVWTGNFWDDTGGEVPP